MAAGAGQSLSTQDDLIGGERAPDVGKGLLNGQAQSAPSVAELHKVAALVAAGRLTLPAVEDVRYFHVDVVQIGGGQRRNLTRKEILKRGRGRVVWRGRE